jgi:hypothetical protein
MEVRVEKRTPRKIKVKGQQLKKVDCDTTLVNAG